MESEAYNDSDDPASIDDKAYRFTLDIIEDLRAIPRGTADQALLQNLKGLLDACIDFEMLLEDIRTCHPEAIKDAKVLMGYLKTRDRNLAAELELRTLIAEHLGDRNEEAN